MSEEVGNGIIGQRGRDATIIGQRGGDIAIIGKGE